MCKSFGHASIATTLEGAQTFLTAPNDPLPSSDRACSPVYSLQPQQGFSNVGATARASIRGTIRCSRPSDANALDSFTASLANVVQQQAVYEAGQAPRLLAQVLNSWPAMS
jgi:hypothetical protein